MVTGAQKPIDLAITDARSNLLDSLRFASDPRAHGTVIVFGGKVIAGTRAKKEFSKSYNAFSSINYPDIAVIHDNRIVFYIDDKEQSTKLLKFYHEMNDRVFLLKLIPSIDPGVLENLADSYNGLILESFGVGGLPDYGNHEFAKVLENGYPQENWCLCLPRSRTKAVIWGFIKWEKPSKKIFRFWNPMT